MATKKRFCARLRLEVWRGFERGLTFQQIGEGLGVSAPTAWRHVEQTGGFAPRARQRRSTALDEREREEISRGIAAGWSSRRIAAELGRDPSTISRELARNGGRGCYRAAAAEQRAWAQAARPQRCKLARDHRLRRAVARKLRRYLSPEQIAAWLRREFPDDARMRVSHETIYRSLFIQARGAFRAELRQYLRSHRLYRRPRGASNTISRTTFDGVSISERPAEVEDRAVPGHWEGDLLLGTIDTQIATLVERSTRFVMLVRIPSKETKVVTAALAKHMKRLPSELRKSLTWDRGTELRAYKPFAIETGMSVYFCDPHSPWQRGSNENTNGLLRQYFPKGDDLSKYDQRHLDRVACQLNTRPRETLGWKTPAEVLNELVQ